VYFSSKRIKEGVLILFWDDREEIMAKSVSSKRWLKEHFDDEFVAKAQQEGYRSRAVYKLQEIDDKDNMLKPGMFVLDLGAAPGGWTQYAVNKIGKKGIAVASDILPMEPIPDVKFVEGDFREDDVLDAILVALNNQKPDLVISDMAPNMSGNDGVDQPRAMYLVELALDLARQTLKPGGGFICKVFQGAGSEEYLKEVRQRFSKVTVRKPKASRPRSREVYVVAKGFKG
jgi:23S rRNA (uridine2552-2'-O)-methyltransferase